MLQSKTHFALLLTLSAAGALLNGGAAAQTRVLAGKGDRFLVQRANMPSAQGRASVIVRFDSELTPHQRAQLLSLGADIYRHLPIIRSLALSVPARNLQKLAALSFVRHLSSDMDVKKCDEFTVESSGANIANGQWNLDGTGIGVAVIDSGVHMTGDLAGHLQKGANFVPDEHGQVKPNDTDDLCGHGTHVAGIVAGNGANSQNSDCYRTFLGVAQNASIVPVRVLDANGQGTVSQVISGIQWVISNRKTTKANIRVINLSLGHPVGESYTTDPLCQTVESAWKAGIVVVCSAGNDGRLQNSTDPSLDNEGYGSAYGSIQSPGNDPYVITVGAMKAIDFAFNINGTHTHTRAKDRIATYSSRGPSRLDLVLKPDIVAPGNKVISLEAAKNSTLVTNAARTNELTDRDYRIKGSATLVCDRYFRLSGTSMAAPVVAGAAALLLQQQPNLSPDTMKARLMLSADKWTQPDGTADACTFGAGYLNIPAALASTAVPNQAALSPTLSIDGDNNVTINMDRALWGTDINGQRAIWGATSVNDLRAVWGARAISGSSANILDASRAIWGHSVAAERAIWGHSVWEDRAIWGHGIEGVDLTSTAINGE